MTTRSPRVIDALPHEQQVRALWCETLAFRTPHTSFSDWQRSLVFDAAESRPWAAEEQRAELMGAR